MSSHTIKLAIIGGTGVYQLAQLEAIENHTIQTEYGAPSDSIKIGLLNGKQVAFLARHGEAFYRTP